MTDRADEIAQEKLPEIITAARAHGADKALELFAYVLREYGDFAIARWYAESQGRADKGEA